jgi:uncharacterized protein (DUF169 family)
VGLGKSDNQAICAGAMSSMPSGSPGIVAGGPGGSYAGEVADGELVSAIG